MEFHTLNDKRYWTLTVLFQRHIENICALIVRYKVASLHLPLSRQYQFTSVTNNDDIF